MNVLQLPSEILIRILEYTSARDLSRCDQTCLLFHDLIHEYASLQYKIELAIAALADTSPHIIPVSERLNKLRQLQSAWFSTTLGNSYDFPTRRDEVVYELQHGVFVLGYGQNSVVRDSISVLQLPSIGDPPPAWVDTSLGFDFYDFNVDPEQDLAVYVCTLTNIDAPRATLPIRLRTLSHNQPHPLASLEKLDLSIYLNEFTALIHIFGDYLGVLIKCHHEDDVIFVCDWKTGQILVKLEHEEGFDSFIFLSPEYFMVAVNDPLLSLNVYSFRPNQPATFVAAFHLPPLYRSDVIRMSTQPGRCEPDPVFRKPIFLDDYPVPAHTTNESHERKTHHSPYLKPDRVPHRPSVDDFRIMVLSLRETIAHRAHEHTIHVAITELYHRARAFDRKYNIAATRGDLQEQPWDNAPCDKRDIPQEIVEGLHPTIITHSPSTLVVPWEDWGPQSSRLMANKHSFQWVCYVHGTRVVLPTRYGHGVEILDFNPASTFERNPFRRGRNGRQTTGSVDVLCTEPDVVSHSTGPFKDDVTTHLPYHRTEKSGVFVEDPTLHSLRAPMLDGERLVIYNMATWSIEVYPIV